MTLLGDHVDSRNSGIGKQFAHRLWRRDPVPGIECRVQIGTYATYGGKPDFIGGRENTRALRCDRQLPARTYHAPELSHLCLHVRHEEDAKHACHGVKTLVGEAEASHVSAAELNVA